MKKFFVLFILVFLASCGIKKSYQDLPNVTGISKIDTVRTKISDTHYSLGKNNLFQNKYGVWELYIEGDALELGLANGALTQDLIHHQENAFMGKINEMVPSEGYRNFLKKLVSWFNRKMYLYVPEEYKQEIYGVSRFGLKKYDEFAPAYLRMLYFHGAHDIGHALQDLMLVGCTSFAAWDDKTADGKLLLGRNFDFYAGDEFSNQKMVAFVNPDDGHKFMMYTWGGMIGAVSGMNEEGITVTINAGKSKIPMLAKDPITLVSREILQHASNLEDAIEIARKREVFVSESIMVGSAKDHKAILIEVSPKNFGVYEVENSDQLICSNHFQSSAYQDDKRNQKTIKESHSQYRYERMTQLVSKADKLTPKKAVEILRNRRGLNGEQIGYGNEKAINQLLAHHGIVFKPEEKKVWLSANPYQMGAFISYDLENVFAEFGKGNVSGSVMNAEEIIPESNFLQTKYYKNYEEYRKIRESFVQDLEHENPINPHDAEALKQLNPYFWQAYYLSGQYYYREGNYKKAIIDFKQALRREISTLPEKEHIKKLLKKSYRKL
ncbi:acyl-CoA--6-aminopenicillanic acid acyl-transferase [Zunongwangia sp. SCSIO 43204]|uniref:C45 family autoproteolytic acyltransferase/hydolase n=1 Tax=Zunongwangia sp. SCSIO 43204 TaxID=2779359 RepID=UPI001CA9C370|nr:C45 family autoproteolytic acyltransferase/hydolase [Zunongwangia sp. SCSIO 43204]UAB83486.1 acyl-CoA--6-aminopenicillanic acid acyl-transferase [Zunongwangia sp. SCSIO 43204]